MYVNGYVLSVPEEKKEAYVREAKIFAEIVMDFGALEIFTNWELEVPDGDQTDFRKAVKAKPVKRSFFRGLCGPIKKPKLMDIKA